MEKVDEINIIKSPNMTYPIIFFILFIVVMLYLVFLKST